MIGLIDTAEVFTENPSTGAFDVPATTGLACRLAHIKAPASTGPDRDEMAARRNFIWEPSYVLPQFCQVEVNGDGLRWNPVATNAFEAYRGPNGDVVYRRCDVIRAA